MTGEDEDGSGQGQFASPPCFMHELDPARGDMPVDRQQARDVARWRKIERERLIAARMALSVEERTKHAQQIADDSQPHDILMDWIVTGSASPKPRSVVSQRPA